MYNRALHKAVAMDDTLDQGDAPAVALLARLLDGITRPAEVTRLARQLLDRFGSLTRVLDRAPDAMRLGGAIDAAVAERLETVRTAALHLHRPLPGAPAPLSRDALESYARARLVGGWGERAIVLFFDADETMLPGELLFDGQLSATALDPRRIFHRALDLGAVAILVAHNHPSGSAEPSASDLIATRALVRTGAMLNVRVLDHIILSRTGGVSLRERGML